MGRTFPTECEHGYTVDGGDFATTEVCPICDGIDDEPKPRVTLRDYFAASALQGLLAGYTRLSDDPELASAGIIANQPQAISELAYLHADTMLKARGNEGGE